MSPFLPQLLGAGSLVELLAQQAALPVINRGHARFEAVASCPTAASSVPDDATYLFSQFSRRSLLNRCPTSFLPGLVFCSLLLTPGSLSASWGPHHHVLCSLLPGEHLWIILLIAPDNREHGAWRWVVLHAGRERAQSPHFIRRLELPALWSAEQSALLLEGGSARRRLPLTDALCAPECVEVKSFHRECRTTG